MNEEESGAGRGGRTCRLCGCTDARPCPGGCWWVGEDLCSACAARLEGCRRALGLGLIGAVGVGLVGAAGWLGGWRQGLFWGGVLAGVLLGFAVGAMGEVA